MFLFTKENYRLEQTELGDQGKLIQEVASQLGPAGGRIGVCPVPQQNPHF